MVPRSLPARLALLLFHPALLVGMLLAGWAMIGAGVRPGTAVLATNVATLLLVLLAEAAWPLEQRRTPRWVLSGADLGHLLLSNGLTLAVGRALLTGALISAATWLHAQGWRPDWPSHWPVVLQLVLAILVGDAVQYAWHRTMHRVPLLWRFHAIHHSPAELRGASAAWGHPLEVASVVFCKEIPLVLLGAPPTVLALVGIAFATNGFLQHANVAARTGWLDTVFATRSNHVLHHEIEPGREVNFGSFTVLWDRLFGTHGRPALRAGAPVRTGIVQAVGERWWDHVAAPARWDRLPRLPHG